ncbi:hypothetical protein COCMIDRAFT_99009 [Bipolaris oryzae ATCC 44560]|uniref:Uncharacterized protein n=1 Tax=Bipolaris oryzae ATCC 44560 TaxID=930090 RepID=W6YXH0_COCMI|nr:uncharacterized protein COCMIDRAFT_99009 [Bipolaris oryzae ATCC 44560]EUC44112.1 hypothetical protein COCMIDRAFT_99009 [Bipolaris oryzae ATCC 44560]
MDDHPIAHADDSRSSTATLDHIAHHETETPQDGGLNHIDVRSDLSWLHSSCWKFQSIDGDRRAAAHGFVVPEELLLVTDNSNERHDDIKIVWTGIAGDPGSRSAIVGTASQHLQTIYELRSLLGLPMSFRGKVPSYPDNADIRVKQYWERKHGLQSLVRAVQAQSVGQQELPPTTPDPSLTTQEASDSTARETYSLEETQPARTYQLPERIATSDNHDEVAQPQESSTSATFSGSTSHATDTWSPSDLENIAKLPCIDCGDNGGHASDCNIGNLKFKEHLTMIDYRVLADIVEQFDPGPWTTHFNLNREREPEDPLVQIAGLAEVIRNEDSYKNDPELHGLPDVHMIILWAFKTLDGVEVLSV